MMQERYIITGANGHLGHNLVRKLLDEGAHIRAFLLPGERFGEELSDACEIVHGDVCSPEDVARLMADAQDAIVIHAAGIVSIASRATPLLEKVNVDGTRNVVEACVQAGVKRLVYVSSVHAIPESPNGEIIAEVSSFSPDTVHGAYARTKASATRLVLEAVAQGLDAVIVHPSGIIGPGDYGDAHMTRMILDYAQGRLPMGVGGGYDFVDARDVAEGIVLAARKGTRGESYILSNRYMTIREMFSWLRSLTCNPRVLRMAPLLLAKAVAPFFELYGKIRKQRPLYTRYSLYTLGSNAFFSHEKATRKLGYKPRPVEETLADTLAWLRRKGRLSST